MLPSDGNNEHIILLMKDDQLHCLVTDETVEFLAEFGGSVNVYRASHVEPNNMFLRWLFHMLRSFKSIAIDEWTRCWYCSWRINLMPMNGPIWGRFYNRQDALQAEVNWIATKIFGYAVGA